MPPALQKKAAELGRSRKMPLRADWEQIKDDVMYRAVRKKFETHAQLRDLLLSTGDEDIVENAPGDYYLTVTGISENAVPVASYDIDDVQEYTSSPRSHHLGGGANDRAC